MTKTAAALQWILGFGFGLPCAYGAWYLAKRGEVWTFLGFPTYGGGPFQGVGLRTSVPLLLAFLGVCIAEVVIGMLLWSGSRLGGVLSMVLLPAEFVFWIGFALPLGPAIGIGRTILILVAWSSPLQLIS